MWHFLAETLFDVLPWKVQLALLAGAVLIIATLVFWAVGT